VYATSLALLVVAGVSVYLGFRRGNVILIYASIAASMLSMLFNAVSVLRRRAADAGATRGTVPFSPAPVEEGTPAVHDVPEESPGSS